MLALCALVFLPACTAELPLAMDDVHELGTRQIAVPVALEYGVSPRAEARSEFTVTAGTGSIRVEGVLWTGQGGYSLRATGAREVSTVRLDVLAEQTSPGITIPIPNWYDAVLRDLPAGVYTLQIVHRQHDDVHGVLTRQVIVR